jgi:hypothetical protein
VDDINITLALGGSPLIALLAATTITVGWAGTLADARIVLQLGTLLLMREDNGWWNFKFSCWYSKDFIINK